MAANYDDFLQQWAQLQATPPSASMPLASYDPSLSAPVPEDTPTPQPPSGGLPPAIAQSVMGALPPAAPKPMPMPMPVVPTNTPPPSMPPPSAPKPFSFGQGLGDEDLAAAQEDARRKRLGVGIAQALAQGIGTATNTKYDPSLYQNLETAAGQGVKDIQAGRQAQKEKMGSQVSALDLQQKSDAADPSSQRSRVAQEMATAIAKKANIPVDPEKLKLLSANDIDAYMKGELQLADLDQRAKDNQLKRESLNTNKALTLQRSADDKEEKDAKNLQSSLDVARSSSRSPLGKAANNYNAASRIQALVQPYVGKEDTLTPQQVYELARATDSLLSQSGATIGGTEHLVPKTALGDLSSWKNFISNQPGGANQGAWVRNMVETAVREKNLSKNQIDAELNGIIASGEGSRLQKTNPDRFKRITDSYKKSLYDADSSSVSYDSDVLEYAKMHNISPDQANHIKLSRTRGQAN
jgi:hypothetical protein